MSDDRISSDEHDLHHLVELSTINVMKPNRICYFASSVSARLHVIRDISAYIAEAPRVYVAYLQISRLVKAQKP